MIFQTDQQFVVPEEFYNKYGTTRQSCDGVGSINQVRSKNNTRGFITSDREWHSTIVSMTCTTETFDIHFYPVVISKQTGFPALSSSESILQELVTLSKDFDTEIQIKDGIGTLTINR